jgi:anti-anti-sigma factor
VTELSVSVSTEDREGGSRTVVRLVGEADVTTRALWDALDAEAAKKPRLLLVDVSRLAFIDSSALHEIVRAYRWLRADGCLLALISPSPGVARVLQLSALDQVIPVHNSLEEAGAQLPSTWDAPARAKAMATARPMPLSPPVITAALPASRPDPR